MNRVVIANIISLTAMILMCTNGLVKNKKKFLIVQNIQMMLLTLTNFLLGASTGIITNAIGIIRNTLGYFGKLNKVFSFTIVGITAVLSLYFNENGIIGVMPLFAAVPYTFLMNKFNDKQMKALTLYTNIPWAIYDISMMNYVAFCFDIGTAITCLVAYIQLCRLGNKKDQDQ